eukprot:scaffold310265_cov15-Prasinocladus_malaysianus.AAC.1
MEYPQLLKASILIYITTWDILVAKLDTIQYLVYSNNNISLYSADTAASWHNILKLTWGRAAPAFALRPKLLWEKINT